MRLTLLGVLGFVAVAALLICVAYEMERAAKQKHSLPPPENL